jgi:hypothetical protein
MEKILFIFFGVWLEGLVSIYSAEYGWARRLLGE